VTGYRSIVAEGWRGGWQPPLTAGGRWRAPVGSSGGAGGGGVGGAGGGGGMASPAIGRLYDSS